MKKSVLLVGILIAVGLGCSSDVTESKQEEGVRGTVSDRRETREASHHQGWELNIRVACGSDRLEQCKGAYGFSLSSDATYEVGPGPDAQILKGYVVDRDYKPVLQLVTSVISHAAEQEETCVPDLSDTAHAELKLFDHAAGETVLVRAKDKSTCYLKGKESEAKSLLRHMRELLEKYYVVPFPGECANAASALEKLYPALQRCASDSDCAYVDDSFNAIASSTQDVIVDDCSMIRPIVVANSFEALGYQRQLLISREIAREYCSGLSRPYCHNPILFSVQQGAPACKLGRCVINPSIVLRY